MEDNRKSPRYFIHWRSAIVIEENGGRETIQCKTSDVSITGVSVICHRNISLHHGVTVYLLIDPGNNDHPQVIVEAQGSVMNNVFSGQQGGFRLGIQFSKFARDGKQILQNNLPKETVQPARRAIAADVAPVADATKVADASPSADVVPTSDEAPGSVDQG